MVRKWLLAVLFLAPPRPLAIEDGNAPNSLPFVVVNVCSVVMVPSLSSLLDPDPDPDPEDALSLSLSESQLELEHELPSSSHLQIEEAPHEEHDALDPDPDAMVPLVMVPTVRFLPFLSSLPFRCDIGGRSNRRCLHEQATFLKPVDDDEPGPDDEHELELEAEHEEEQLAVDDDAECELAT